MPCSEVRSSFYDATTGPFPLLSTWRLGQASSLQPITTFATSLRAEFAIIAVVPERQALKLHEPMSSGCDKEPLSARPVCLFKRAGVPGTSHATEVTRELVVAPENISQAMQRKLVSSHQLCTESAEGGTLSRPTQQKLSRLYTPRRCSIPRSSGELHAGRLPRKSQSSRHLRRRLPTIAEGVGCSARMVYRAFPWSIEAKSDLIAQRLPNSSSSVCNANLY